LIVEGNNDPVKLLVSDPSSFPIFADLVPIEDWHGRTVASISCIPGRFVFSTLGPANAEEKIFMFHFTGAEDSLFFMPGDWVVSTAEQATTPNIDLLVETEIITKAYGRQIKRQKELAKHQKYYELWGFELMKPGLVDIFAEDWVPPKFTHIIAIHKIYDASRCEYGSHDVYMLRFSDGSLSTPLGICSGHCLSIDVDGLVELGFISKEQLDRAKDKLNRKAHKG
jgi:hypothetical protein